jgi:hypothetical protein
MGAVAFFASCKKEPQISPPIVPASLSVTVDTAKLNGFGQVNPLHTTVSSGDSLAIIVTPNPGCRINAVLINNVATAFTSDIIKIRNIRSDLVVMVSLTDSLTTTQLVLLKTYLTGPVGSPKQFIDSAEWQRGTGGYPLKSWQPILPFSPSGPFDYLSNGTYQEFNNSSTLTFQGTWSLSYNGKVITIYDPKSGGSISSNILELDAQREVYDFINFEGKGHDFKYTSVVYHH